MKNNSNINNDCSAFGEAPWMSAKYVVHPELSEKNGVATHPFRPEETPDEASS